MIRPSKTTLAAAAVALLVVVVGSGWVGVALGRHYELNKFCCLMPRSQNILLAFKETLGVVRFYAQTGQDRWVTETMFPGVTNGFFLDVGSGDGTVSSNTKALEKKGWTGICVDPFPSNMGDRTCRLFKEVVYDVAGKVVKFYAAGGVGGIAETMGSWKAAAETAPTVDFTTVTLADILDRAKAPRLIHFMSLDIEGAELEALQGFPFDTHTIGALAVEHNFEEPKRSRIEALMKSHGYKRFNSLYQDDFYVPMTQAISMPWFPNRAE